MQAGRPAQSASLLKDRPTNLASGVQLPPTAADKAEEEQRMPEVSAVAEPPRVEPEHTPADLGDGLRLVRRLARGGFAEVWEAEQVSLGRRVAVKIMRHELLGLPRLVRLFEQEARVLARLNHPNVVQVIDRGTSLGGPYFVMEYVEGETLQSLLSRGTLGRDRALAVFLQAVRGLAYAHLNGVVHRDVKPANILVSSAGKVKIGDFGIATVRAATESEAGETPGREVALGTRAYMSPEQRTSFDLVEPPADVYSLGVILHRILTGGLPDRPESIAPAAEIPPAMREIIQRSLSQSAADRFPDAGAFREALVNALEGRHLDAEVRRGAVNTLSSPGGFELLDVIRQDRWRSVYLVRRGGESGERIVVKRYVRNRGALEVVRAMTRIEHPNIIRILAVGEREDEFIILMEHLPGGDLRERLVQPHPWRKTARLALEVSTALACAHGAGIVHGNLRPSNILFDGDGKIRVTDFGLPEHYRGDPSVLNWYAAPEQDLSPARDIYALGAIMFEMLFAMPPTEEHRLALLEPEGGSVPRVLRDVVRRMLAPASSRVERAEHVARELTQLLEEDAESRLVPRATGSPGSASLPGEARMRRPSVGPALLGLGGLVLVWLLGREAVQQWIVRLVSEW
jgi:serine/threonine-protein kinase